MDHVIDEELDLEAGETIRKIKRRRFKLNQRKSQSMNCHLKYSNRTSLLATPKDHQDFISSIPCHVIFVFLNTILLGVLQVQYQNKKKSPLDDHTVHMQTFLTAICIYCALVGIKIYKKTRGGCGGGDYEVRILRYAIPIFGIISSATLVSILLQPQLFVAVVLFIWGTIGVVLAGHLIKSFVCWIIEIVKPIMVLIFNNKKDSAGGSNNTTNSNVRVEGIA